MDLYLYLFFVFATNHMAKLAMALIYPELINTRRHLKPRWILAILTDVQWITSFTEICIKLTKILRKIFTSTFV